MKALLVGLFMVLTGVGIASAGEEHESVKIKVIKSVDGDDATFSWSGDPGDLDDLAVGESKTLKDGVVVTRNDDGLSFEIDGETIDVPVLHGHNGTKAFMLKGDHDGDVNVEVIEGGGSHMAIRAHPMNDGIMIASGEAIDESTQETIRSVLQSAGYEQDVRFIDRSSMHAQHVTVIKERIEEVHED